MLLNVRERLMLLNSLPKEGNVTTLRIIQKLKEYLGFTEEEYAKYNFVETNGMVQWDTEVEQDKEVPVGEKATDLVIEVLKQLDTEKKLTEQHVSLWEKFVDNGHP